MCCNYGGPGLCPVIRFPCLYNLDTWKEKWEFGTSRTEGVSLSADSCKIIGLKVERLSSPSS